jgi:molybdopterin synthase catalytic subunit
MLVQVRLFAMLRERAGRSSVELELSEGATAADALAAVGEEHGLEELIARMPVVMAVNRQYAPDDSPLSEGDELALIPPVSGGAGEGGGEANLVDSGAGDGEVARSGPPRDGKVDTTGAKDGVAKFKATATARVVPSPKSEG